jgi:gliding motility-associated-like protein
MHIQKPIAAFTLDDSAGICTPMQTNFTPAGQYYDSLYWEFGDGTTSTLDTVTHFYNNYGTAPSYAFEAKLVLQGAGGCRDSATRNVYVFQPYNVTTLTFSPPTNCDSVTARFDIGPPPYTDFKLVFGDGAIDSSGNTTVSHTYKSLGTYAPQVALQDASGCLVNINRGNIMVLGSVPIFSVNKKDMCDTGTVYFQGIVISNDGQSTLTWDFADGTPPISTPTPLGTPNDPFLTQTHFYDQPGLRLATLKVTTNSGCNESYTDTIHIWQTPHPLISTEGTMCTGLVQFHGNVTIPNIDSVIYAWTFSNGAGSGSKDPYLQFPPGPLTAHLKTSVAYGCNDTTSQPVTIFPLPEITGPSVITTPVGIPVTLPFTYSSNVTTYTWSPSTYLDCTDCSNPVSTPIFNTTYTISVTDENHCTSLDTVVVKTLCGEENYFVPNTFSPNNDGLNDFFYPRGKGLHDIQSMRVFNRWGQLVFERKNFPANSASMGWDGTINGRPAPSDAYVYIIEVICINAQVIALKGDVTLIR